MPGVDGSLVGSLHHATLLGFLLLSSGWLLITFEGGVEPPANQAALVHHLVLAGAALFVALSSTFLVR